VGRRITPGGVRRGGRCAERQGQQRESAGEDTRRTEPSWAAGGGEPSWAAGGGEPSWAAGGGEPSWAADRGELARHSGHLRRWEEVSGATRRVGPGCAAAWRETLGWEAAWAEALRVMVALASDALTAPTTVPLTESFAGMRR
jgi:hypothetical protein